MPASPDPQLSHSGVPRQNEKGSYSLYDVILLLFMFVFVLFFESVCKVFGTNSISTDAGTSVSSWLMPLVHRKATRLGRISAST